MKTLNIVNGYVLSNLFYELIFLDKNGIQAIDDDWSNPGFVEQIIRTFVIPRYESFKDDTKQVVENTLRYLIAAVPENAELWGIIWQAGSAPIPTPEGIRAFILRCYCVMFPSPSLPTIGDVQSLTVNHSAQMANQLN